MLPLKFYDVEAREDLVPGKAASPYTWKLRLALGYKNIPFETIWIQHPDVEAHAKSIGASPTGKKPDGSPMYTVPFILDPNTDTIVSDSTPCIIYLDKTYPDTPRLHHEEYDTFYAAFLVAVGLNLQPIVRFAIPATLAVLPPRSKEYRRAFLTAVGFDVDGLLPKGSKWDEEWEKVKNGFGEIDSWMKEGQKFVMGDTLTTADLDIAGRLYWYMQIWGKDSREWRDISSWQNGRWGKLVENMQQYATL